ncbi:MAG: WYL domain-containing protein [Planctomycetota bacterium]|nr:MAG: WYL domain-containing protein [Planctomycetota bacterium]
MTVGRVSRMVQVLTTLQSGQRYAVDDFAEILGISRRSVFRDLKDLRTAGIPVHYDKKKRCYAVDEEFFLSPPELTTQEALSLLLRVHKAKNHIQLPFKESALRAALKLESSLPVKIRQYCGNALRNISIRPEPIARLNSLDRVFAQLQRAISKKETVKIRYCVTGEQKSELTDLDPYHLIHCGHTWHVVGKSSFHGGIRTFKLNEIRELTALDRLFVEEEEFDVEEYIGRAWSAKPEGRLYNVKLRFAPAVAHSVANVQWHKTQKVTFQSDDSAILEFRVDGLNEITWWVPSYGNAVEVLAPRILRQRIVKIAEEMVRSNED